MTIDHCVRWSKLTLDAASQSYSDSSSYRATTLSWEILQSHTMILSLNVSKVSH